MNLHVHVGMPECVNGEYFWSVTEQEENALLVTLVDNNNGLIC